MATESWLTAKGPWATHPGIVCNCKKTSGAWVQTKDGGRYVRAEQELHMHLWTARLVYLRAAATWEGGRDTRGPHRQRAGGLVCGETEAFLPVMGCQAITQLYEKEIRWENFLLANSWWQQAQSDLAYEREGGGGQEKPGVCGLTSVICRTGTGFSPWTALIFRV